MPDNMLVQDATGASVNLRTKDHGTVEVQYVYVATAVPTVVAGNQSISVTSTAGSSLTVPAGATHAVMTVDTGGGDIRYWEDGTTPASGSVGLLAPAGTAVELTNLAGVRLRASTGTVPVNISYRRYDL